MSRDPVLCGSFAVITNVVDLAHMQLAPLPLLSCGMEPCVKRGVDVAAGGAKYNSTGTAGVGVSNTADALAAIKKFVFDDKKYSGAELLSALKTNWEGREALRSEIIAGTPGYGNDDPYVDELARWVAGVYCKLTKSAPNLGRTARTSTRYRPTSPWVTAGRLRREKGRQRWLTGFRPCTARIKTAPRQHSTAAMVDHLINSNGTLLNLKFHPSAVKARAAPET